MSPEQRILLDFCKPPSGVIIVNDRVCIHTEGFRRVVLVHGVIVAHYDKDDRAADEYALLTLLDTGYAEQKEIAFAFSCSARSIRRYSERFESGGLPALGRARGRPSKVVPKKADERDRTILRMKERGFSNRGIAQRLVLAENSVRKRLRRLGWKPLTEDTAEAHENLGLLRLRQARFDLAAAHLRRVLQLRPDAEAHHLLGRSLVMLGKPEDAVIHYSQAVRLKPDWPEALNDLAWILATHPKAKIRNGPEAVHLAKRASQLTGGKVARFWGTLDAAYAEVAKFADAVKAAERARKLALASGKKDIAQAAERRLILYRKHPVLSRAASAKPQQSTSVRPSAAIPHPSSHSLIDEHTCF